MKSMAIRMAMSAERATEPVPITATLRRLKWLPPSASVRKPARGNVGISQSRGSTLSPHLTHRVCIQCLEAAVQQQQQCQADRDFSRRHRQDKDEHYLTVGLHPVRTGNHEGKPG